MDRVNTRDHNTSHYHEPILGGDTGHLGMGPGVHQLLQNQHLQEGTSPEVIEDPLYMHHGINGCWMHSLPIPLPSAQDPCSWNWGQRNVTNSTKLHSTGGGQYVQYLQSRLFCILDRINPMECAGYQPELSCFQPSTGWMRATSAWDYRPLEGPMYQYRYVHTH